MSDESHAGFLEDTEPVGFGFPAPAPEYGGGLFPEELGLLLSLQALVAEGGASLVTTVSAEAGATRELLAGIFARFAC